MKTLSTFIPLVVAYNAMGQHSYATRPGGDLYILDVANCTSQFVGSTGLGFGDLALTPNGTLYGIVSGEIWNIDTATAAVTYVGATTAPGVTLVALNDTVLLEELGGDLFGISTIDATTWLIGNIGFGSPGDLTWFDNDLYMTSDGLVRISLNSTATAITAVNVFNGGDPNFPGCMAIISAWLNPNFQSVIGLSGQDAYAFCYLDGTYSLLCPNISPGGAPGAACPRLPPPSTQTGCTNPLFISPSNSGPVVSLSNSVVSAGVPFVLSTARHGLIVTQLFTSHGALAKTATASDDQTVTVPTSGLSGGLYFLRVMLDTQQVFQAKVVVH